MKGIQTLVPPLEMCQKIPDGMFKDTVFVWWGDQYFQHYHVAERYAEPDSTRDAIAAPAPTLQEIMEKSVSCFCGKPVQSQSAQFNNFKDAEDALKYWLFVNSEVKK